MTHEVADMVMCGTEQLCQGVRRIHNSRDMGDDHFSVSSPFLKSKMLDINMACTRCRVTGTYHENGCRLLSNRVVDLSCG